MRYGYFEKSFFLPKYVTPLLYSIEMGRKICAIETKYGFEGSFKSIVDIPNSTKNFTLLELGCKDSIAKFIVQNFKLDMSKAPWMYDTLRVVIKIISSSKKCPSFAHEYRPHVEYFVNKIEQEIEMYTEWEFTPLNEAWMMI